MVSLKALKKQIKILKKKEKKIGMKRHGDVTDREKKIYPTLGRKIIKLKDKKYFLEKKIGKKK